MECVVRGEMRVSNSTESTELSAGSIRVERGKADMLETRMSVERGWRTVGLLLAAGGDRELAPHGERIRTLRVAPLAVSRALAEDLDYLSKPPATTSSSRG